MSKKNILVCVSGLTPQVVSEALFCLSVREKTKIDEIYVLTTKRGRDVILGLDKDKKTPKTDLKSEINNLCERYKISKPLFENNDTHIIVAKEESIELPDIRSDKDNILFPNKTAVFLRKKTSDPDNRIFCSITGGRKSMSVHIANVLSLFARENDRLLHVLTKEEFEFNGFYPMNKNEANSLELSDIPFVRLRSIISEQISSTQFMEMNYDKIVSFMQKQLKKSTYMGKLQLVSDTNELRFADNIIQFEPLAYAIYHFFVESKANGKNKISISELTEVETAHKVLEFLKQYYPFYDSKLNIKKPWWKNGFDAADFRSKITKINNKIDELIIDPDIAGEYKISSYKNYPNSSYGIKAKKNKFRLPFPY